MKIVCNKLISIIVPIYNVELYLHRCIDSILNQTYENLEILLIDDGSKDGCGLICDQYAKNDSRIKVFHIDNQGLSAARNLGFKMSNGQYIGYVDSDDWIEPDMYEKLLGRIEETKADVSVCGFWYESEKGDVNKRTYSTDRVYNDTEALEALLVGELHNYVWNKLYRRSVLSRGGYLPGREKL